MQLLHLFLSVLPLITATPLPIGKTSGRGEATYYTPGLGACGNVHGPTDLIAAVAISRGKGECGKKIRVTRDGKSVDVVIQDLCQGCKENDIDLTPGAFQQLGTLDEGRVKCTWKYI
ncbi:hypothetical protein K440DRAFT_584304 [Wilcoxina mikolae CBS 423.85]|nr:hypothetical protein K440DRAFT_584304 [Wilcoxina mikolae CBS 423.85]